MNNPLPRSRHLNVQLQIKNRTIAVEGAVLHSHTLGEHSSYKCPGMGLKFTRIAPQDREFIRHYIRDEVTREIKTALAKEPSALGDGVLHS
jgi:hypothetical protein